MTTAIDTNVIIAPWDKSVSLNSFALAGLESAVERGPLLISAPVFAELLAAQRRTEAFADAFLEHSAIAVDWELEELIWRRAVQATQQCVERRRKLRDFGTRRILADFLIGAHAETRGYRPLTLDEHIYHRAIPKLALAVV